MVRFGEPRVPGAPTATNCNLNNPMSSGRTNSDARSKSPSIRAQKMLYISSARLCDQLLHSLEIAVQ